MYIYICIYIYIYIYVYIIYVRVPSIYVEKDIDVYRHTQIDR